MNIKLWKDYMKNKKQINVCLSKLQENKINTSNQTPF